MLHNCVKFNFNLVHASGRSSYGFPISPVVNKLHNSIDIIDRVIDYCVVNFRS